MNWFSIILVIVVVIIGFIIIIMEMPPIWLLVPFIICVLVIFGGDILKKIIQ